jgi:hypothetical protein
MSLASASARPNPAAGPFTAAMIGCGVVRSRKISLDMCCWFEKWSRAESVPSFPGAWPYP